MRDDDRAQQRDVNPAAGAPGKRPYVKPQMREYGSIAKLTQSGGSTKPEAGTMKSGTCL